MVVNGGRTGTASDPRRTIRRTARAVRGLPPRLPILPAFRRPGKGAPSRPGVTFVTRWGAGLARDRSFAYSETVMSTPASTGAPLAPQLGWLAAVIQLAITPVFLGALVLWLAPQRSGRDMAVGAGLALLESRSSSPGAA